MKCIASCLFAVAVLVPASERASAQVGITPSRDEVLALERRVERLERRIAELQRDLDDVASRTGTRYPTPSPTPLPDWACSVKTKLGEVYVGKGPTIVEAKARAIQECQKASGSTLRCDLEPQCGR